MLLLMGVFLTVVQKSVGRKLSVELGGELADEPLPMCEPIELVFLQVLSVFKLFPLWWLQ